MLTTEHPEDVVDLVKGADQVTRVDPILAELISSQRDRTYSRINLVASAGLPVPGTRFCEASTFGSLTTEGNPGHRYHPGSDLADRLETLAIERAKQVFHAKYVSVQPHSCTTANQAVIFSLLHSGDTVLHMALPDGGHLSHATPLSIAGRTFHGVGYGVNSDGWLDYAEVRKLARSSRPKLIIAGASSYSRTIDFEQFRLVADEVGAWLLVDMSHIAGLVAANLHPSPIDHADVVTTSSYKQLLAGRGGLIVAGSRSDRIVEGTGRTLAETLDRAVFPLLQGTPSLGSVAGKAFGLGLVASDWFRVLMQNTCRLARELAEAFSGLGYEIVSRGTDNHLVMLDFSKSCLTGRDAELALSDGGVYANRNLVPSDRRPPSMTSGLRLGALHLAARGFESQDIDTLTHAMDQLIQTGPTCVGDGSRAGPSTQLLALLGRRPYWWDAV
jgi:glycine hydroxymethyltransferase